MRFGLPTSFALHAGFLGWAFISFGNTEPYKIPEPQPVEVAIITEDGLTRLTKGSRDAKLLKAEPKPPAPEIEKKKQVKKPKPLPGASPPPEPAEVAPPEPEQQQPPPPETAEPKSDPIAEKLAMLPPEPKGPTPEELAALEKAAAEKKKAEEAKRKAEEDKKRKAEEKKKQDAEKKKKLEAKKKKEELKKRRAAAKRKAALKKKRELAKKRAREKKRRTRDDFFADMQAGIDKKALLDKDPTRRPPPPGESAAGAPEGRDTRLTASELSLMGAKFRRAVSRCWNINSGAAGVENIRIEVDIRLKRDGRLVGRPRVVSRGSGSSVFQHGRQCA